MAELTQELMEQLKALGINTASQAAAPQTGGLTWAQPAASVNVAGWDSVAVPLDIPTNKGNCTVYLNFSGVNTPEAVGSLVKMLIDRGFPVRAYTPKNSGGFSAK